MYNKLKSALIDWGFNCIDDSYSGVLNDYEVSVAFDMFGVYAHISAYMTKDQRSNIKGSMQLLANKYSECTWSTHGVTLSITEGNESIKLAVLSNWLTGATTIMKNNGAVGNGVCPICGKSLDSENSKACSFDGLKVTLDNECAAKIVIKQEEQQRVEDTAPNNYGKGFAGALLGGLCGAIVATVLYIIGFISAFSSIIAFVLGIVFYKAFGGKKNWVMILIVSLTTLVTMVLSVLTINIVYLYIMTLMEGYTLSPIEVFVSYMQVKEYSIAFWRDIGLTAMFTVLSSLFVIIRFIRIRKRKK